MNIVGKKVYHRLLLGNTDVEGIIQGVNKDETIIDISFKNDSQPIRQFLVPQAFEPHDGAPANLFSHDPEISNWLKNLSAHTCSLCHCRLNKLSKLGDYLVCDNCKKHFRICSNCGKYVHPDSVKYHFSTEKLLCKDCYTATHKKCSVCNRVLPNEFFVRSDFLPDDRPVCSRCVDNKLIECTDCEKYFPEEQINYIFGLPYCFDCYNKSEHICRKCGSRLVESSDGLCDPCHWERVYHETFATKSYFDKKIYPISGQYEFIKNYRTLSLMSHFSKVPRPYTFQMLLVCDYLIQSGNHYDLVIVPDLPSTCAQYIDFYTMSKFKSECYFQAQSRIIGYLKDEDCIDTDIGHKTVFRLFPKALTLRAQTYSDMDYGINRHQYGDTSSFYIIGALYHKKSIYSDLQAKYERNP